MRQFFRELALVTAIAAGAGLALGLILGMWTGESIPRWLAYGLDIAGAVMIGLGFLSGPESPRKRFLRERLLKEEAPPKGESRLIPFVIVGLALVAAGTLFEMAI
jgi:hypothetical protein